MRLQQYKFAPWDDLKDRLLDNFRCGLLPLVSRSLNCVYVPSSENFS